MRGEYALYRAAIRAVAEHAGLEPATLMAPGYPRRWLGALRWVVFKLLAEQGMSRAAIGRVSGRGFNAVRYALDRFDGRAADYMPDPDGVQETYAEALAACRERLKQQLNE